MRTSVFFSTLFAASVLAAPLTAESAKRGLDLDTVDLSTLNLDGVDLSAATDLVESLDLDKRQLGLDLSPVTDLVGDLVGTVAGLIPTLAGEISDIEALVNDLLAGTVDDVEAVLTLVTSTLNDILVQLGGLDVGNLRSLTKRQDGAIDLDITSLINQVTGLLGSVLSLTASLDVGSIVDLVEEVLNTLTGLTSILGLKKL